jgi:hypothetical protein
MSAPQTEHAEEVQAPHHAFDSPEEVAHAKLHAVQNAAYFLGIFAPLILLAVAGYYLCGTSNVWVIGGLAVLRCLAIAIFLNWLFHSFSLIFRTFAFIIIFLGGMVFLSWWDSTLNGIGNPIALSPAAAAASPSYKP